MTTLHNYLIQTLSVYHNWHQTKHHNKIHWGVFIVFTLLIFGMILRWAPITFAADTAAPTTPTNLTATAISSSQINLSWTASTDDVGVTGYRLERCQGATCTNFTQIATPTGTIYNDTGLIADTTYRYQVRAVDGAGNLSGYSTISSATTQTQTSGIQLNYAQGEHPRIFIKPGVSDGVRVGLSDIVAKVKEGGSLETMYSQMKQVVRSSPTKIYVAENAALVYLIEQELGNTTEANEFLGYAKNFLSDTRPVNSLRSEGEYSDPVEAPIVYDWIYSGLTETERQNVYNNIITQIQNTQDFTAYNNVNYHYIETAAKAGRDTLLRAIGIWNEGIGDGDIQKKLDSLEAYYKGFFLPSIQLMGGLWVDSEYYDIMNSDSVSVVFFIHLWDEATGQNTWNDTALTKDILPYYTMARKANNTTIHYSDQHTPTPWLSLNIPAPLLEYRNNDGIGQYVTNRMLDQTGTFHGGYNEYYLNLTAWSRIIWYDPSNPEFNRNTFPTAKWFVGNNPKHDFGAVLLRDKWSTTDNTFSGDTKIFFRNGDHFTGKSHFHTNHFGIYKYGDLAIKDGADEIIGGRIDNHYAVYGQSSISANTITVSDPFVMLDEGQEYIINSLRRSNSSISHTLGALPVDVQGADTDLSDHTDNSWVDMGNITHFETTQDYDYVVGDASNAYRFGGGNNPGSDLQQLRLDVFQRELAFLNKKYLVVFDRVRSINPNFIKRWYLHTVLEPEMSGSEIDYQATWNRPYGLDTMGGATEWTGKNMSVRSSTSGWTTPGQGKLFLKMLLPSDGIFRKRGGSSNPNAQVNDANFFEFSSWRHNQNHDYTGHIDNNRESFNIRNNPTYEGRGRWRIEEETWGRTYDNFLNVLYPTEATTAAMPNATVVQVLSNNMAGTLIEDSQTPVVALFSSDPQGGAVSQATYNADYSPTLTGEHFLANIASGTYDVYKNSVRILTGISPSREGMLFFSAQGGSTFQVVQTGAIPPDTQSPTAPTDLTAVAISSSQINLSWTASTDNVGVAGYKIYRCLGSSCAPTVQVATSATNFYSNTGLTASTAYTYAVSAYDAAGNESAKSQSVSATTLFQFKPSDLNQDTKVDQQDFDILKQDFNRTDKPKSDLNQDGIVNSQDLGIMMSSWEN